MNKFKLTLLTASLALATAFTFSCGEHSLDDLLSFGESSSSNGGNSSSGRFTDTRDGHVYLTVKIGNQTWMAQNLNYKYAELGPACYDRKESNCEKYGMLYEYYDAIRVCPTGWHLPTKAEWETLASHVGSSPAKKLKTTSDWRDGGGTDDYGFGALPGGWLGNEFKELNIIGNWWTSTDGNRARIDARDIVELRSVSKMEQHSVRCILGSSSSSSIVYGELVDERDGQEYRTIKIGTQNWMAENLNYEARYSKCYEDKASNCRIYGRLYDWDVAKTVCPEGWKLPTRSEWEALASYIDDNVGRKLKARSDMWGNGYGVDFYGFGALPGGYDMDGGFSDRDVTGWWWTATENSSDRSAGIKMDGGNNIGYDNSRKAANLYSVRCIEDL